jgi:hypothetical protein
LCEYGRGGVRERELEEEGREKGKEREIEIEQREIVSNDSPRNKPQRFRTLQVAIKPLGPSWCGARVANQSQPTT